MASGARPSLVVLAAGKARRFGGCKPLAPVGPHGEAIIDLLASDALSAGFGTIVVVLSPTTGPDITSHIETEWPGQVDVRFAIQESPRGTVDAVLAGWEELASESSFGVANADDLYGIEALRALANHAAKAGPDCALVGFRLSAATIGSSPVTRGVCQVDADGYLSRIDERRHVVPTEDGTFEAHDGREPARIGGDATVSMNLWGLTHQMRPILEMAMKDSLSSDTALEVLLPEVVSGLLQARPRVQRFAVLSTEARCVGVTHPDDLALVQADVAEQVKRGERNADLWPS